MIRISLKIDSTSSSFLSLSFTFFDFEQTWDLSFRSSRESSSILFSMQSSFLCAWILNTLFANTNQSVTFHRNSKNVMSMINQSLWQLISFFIRINDLIMQTTTKIKLRAIFDQQSLKKKNNKRNLDAACSKFNEHESIENQLKRTFCQRCFLR